MLENKVENKKSKKKGKSLTKYQSAGLLIRFIDYCRRNRIPTTLLFLQSAIYLGQELVGIPFGYRFTIEKGVVFSPEIYEYLNSLVNEGLLKVVIKRGCGGVFLPKKGWEYSPYLHNVNINRYLDRLQALHEVVTTRTLFELGTLCASLFINSHMKDSPIEEKISEFCKQKEAIYKGIGKETTESIKFIFYEAEVLREEYSKVRKGGKFTSVT